MRNQRKPWCVLVEQGAGFVLLVALLLVPGRAEADFSGKVVGIHDGDTLTVLVERKQIRIRLVDIDAPELGQPFGRKSRESLAQLCAGREAQVADKGEDRYGRTLGGVSCSGLLTNVEQIRRGMAWVFDRYVDRDSSLYSVQSKARKERVGLWSQPNPIPPWEWRRQKRDRESSR